MCGYTFYCGQWRENRHLAVYSVGDMSEGTCKLAVHNTHYKVAFVRNKVGKVLAIICGYTFYCGASGAKTAIWRCTRWGTCRARFIMGQEGTMVTAFLEHNHDPPMFIIRDVIWAKTSAGKEVLIVNGYSFSLTRKHQKTDYYWCTHGKCNARVVVAKECGTIVKASLQHSHTPRITCDQK